jgi:hydrogenase maturation factor
MSSVRSSSGACLTDHCITCADDGVAMIVLTVDEPAGLALCADDEGARSSVQIALIEPPLPGDRVLVHAGTAIASLQRVGP